MEGEQKKAKISEEISGSSVSGSNKPIHLFVSHQWDGGGVSTIDDLERNMLEALSRSIIT